MAVREHNGEMYGDSSEDTRAFLLEYASNNFLPELFVEPVCECGHRTLLLQVCTFAGVAVRTCLECGEDHTMFDGASYLNEAELLHAVCVCENEEFEITAGIALYSDKSSVRWLYVGGRCVACNRLACYGDWKNEADLPGFLEKA